MDLQAYLHLSTVATHMFPRMGVKDPHERLGLEKNASEKRGVDIDVIRYVARTKARVDAMERKRKVGMTPAIYAVHMQ